MSDEPPTTDLNPSSSLSTQPIEDHEVQPAPAPAPQPFVRPPPSQTFDPAAVFMEAYDCAKLNNNWNKVSSSLMIHPEWLTKIPEGRRWTMLHQIVFSGNVMHLNEVLALQANNPDFRLLYKALDQKTVREVASERAHIHPQMMRRIERLVAVDQLLNNAKDRKWELVKQFITLQPDIVNEKPPYRRFFLAHHLAYVGELNVFKDLSTVCQFKLNLLAENKTVSQVAREHNQIAFAEYVESLATQSDEATNDHSHPSTEPFASGSTYHNPGIYDNPGISFIPLNLDLNNLFPSSTTASSHSHAHHYAMHDNYDTHSDQEFITHSLYHGHMPAVTVLSTTSAGHESLAGDEHSSAHHGASAQPVSAVPQMTDAEQAEYEQTISSNVQKMSKENLLNSITCCITKNIFHDPVVAADGFTYEREAILSWFEQSNRSPQTNEELENLELKPNFAIKSIIQSLHASNASHS